MTTFLMVHGAWHGRWAFDPLRDFVEGAGHRMVAIDLPLDEGRSTLSGWADHVVSEAHAIRASRPREPLILVGHSRGGVVVSAAAEAAPDLFDRLIYIAAFLVPNGMAGADVLRDVPRSKVFDDALSVDETGKFLRFDATAAAEVFAQRCGDEYARDCIPHLRLEPIEPLATPLSLSEERYGRVPRDYIACRYDQALPFVAQQAMLERLPCERVLVLNTDHTPMMSASKDVAEFLLQRV